MFDIGWQEIFLIAVVALIVVGPKDLPRALKTVTGALRKVKGMAREFQSGLDDIVRETELDEMRREIAAEANGDFMKDIENSIDPDGEISRDLNDMRHVESDLSSAAQGFSDDVKKTDVEKDDLPDLNEAMTFDAPAPEPAPDTQTASNNDATAPDKKSGED